MTLSYLAAQRDASSAEILLRALPVAIVASCSVPNAAIIPSNARLNKSSASFSLPWALRRLAKLATEVRV